MEPIMCLSQTNTGNWCQETYETAGRQARRRAAQLRRIGYSVAVSGMGPQVTPVGIVKLTLVDIRPGDNADTYGLPAVRVNGF